MSSATNCTCLPASGATLSRRRLLAGGLAVAGCAALPGAARARLALGPLIAAAPALQRAIFAATQARRVFRLPPGVTRTSGLVLPDGARLAGAPRGSALRLAGPGPLLSAAHGARISLSGLTLDGGAAKLDASHGLIDFHDIAHAAIEGCTIRRAGGIALRLERCGGVIRQCRIEGSGRSALFSLDAAGLVIEDNIIADCGDNGLQVWRSQQGFDGTLLKGNRISGIRNVSGGAGQYGNGISVFRAGGVTASGNTINRVAYSALRNNSGHDVTFSGNDCSDCGETAIFAEFAFRNAVINDNRIDGALSGIQMVNFADAGGRGALCTGNHIRNLRLPSDGAGRQWGYQAAIKAEADALVAGNEIAGAPWMGVMAGWGPSLDAVRVEHNRIAGAPIGIGVSVAPGAGRASVTGNLIAGASLAAVAAMLWDKVDSADLAADAGARFPLITVAGNRAA